MSKRILGKFGLDSCISRGEEMLQMEGKERLRTLGVELSGFTGRPSKAPNKY